MRGRCQHVQGPQPCLSVISVSHHCGLPVLECGVIHIYRTSHCCLYFGVCPNLVRRRNTAILIHLIWNGWPFFKCISNLAECLFYWCVLLLSVCLSVCLSVYVHEAALEPLNGFLWNLILGIFVNFFQQFRILFTSDSFNDHITQRSTCIATSTSNETCYTLLGAKNVSCWSCRE
jgi:hypothetical protein